MILWGETEMPFSSISLDLIDEYKKASQTLSYIFLLTEIAECLFLFKLSPSVVVRSFSFSSSFYPVSRVLFLTAFWIQCKRLSLCRNIIASLFFTYLEYFHVEDSYYEMFNLSSPVFLQLSLFPRTEDYNRPLRHISRHVHVVDLILLWTLLSHPLSS